MPVYNSKPDNFIVTRQMNPCDGCGALIPKGSRVLRWTVWQKGMKSRYRFCSRCQGVIYGCSSRNGERRPISIQTDKHLVRDICESCDGYLTCPKVQYLRDEQPGKVWFGDLEIG